jgi:hypothetical protein
MNPDNDFVVITTRTDGKFDWVRKDRNTGDSVSGSLNQGYENKSAAVDAAVALNPGVEIMEEDTDGSGGS